VNFNLPVQYGYWIAGLLDCVTGLLDCVTGLLDCWIALLDCWIAGLLDCVTGLLDCWIALLDCWIAFYSAQANPGAVLIAAIMGSGMRSSSAQP